MQQFAIVFQPGARGDFLANILLDNITERFASQLAFQSVLDYVKIHVKDRKFHSVFQNYNFSADDFFKYCTRNNIVTIRIHSGFRLFSIENMLYLENFKMQKSLQWLPTELSQWNPEITEIKFGILFKNDDENFDKQYINQYNFIIDFRDLWDPNKINLIYTMITSRKLSDYSLDLIAKNINIQPNLPTPIPTNFNYTSVTKLNNNTNLLEMFNVRASTNSS